MQGDNVVPESGVFREVDSLDIIRFLVCYPVASTSLFWVFFLSTCVFNVCAFIAYCTYKYVSSCTIMCEYWCILLIKRFWFNSRWPTTANLNLVIGGLLWLHIYPH